MRGFLVSFFFLLFLVACTQNDTNGPNAISIISKLEANQISSLSAEEITYVEKIILQMKNNESITEEEQMMAAAYIYEPSVCDFEPPMNCVEMLVQENEVAFVIQLPKERALSAVTFRSPSCAEVVTIPSITTEVTLRLHSCTIQIHNSHKAIIDILGAYIDETGSTKNFTGKLFAVVQ